MRHNLLTDVDGLHVGNAHDAEIATGVTIILPDTRVVAGVDVRGGAPGTRETDALDPACLVDAVDGIFLAGGSSYGLEAGSAMAAWLGAQGRGVALVSGVPPSPVVPGAILFDMGNGGKKDWGETPPYARLAKEACAAAGVNFALGNAGAGFGATAGALKGGLGSASAITSDGIQTGALVAVNAFGSGVIPGTQRLWAAAFERDNEMGTEWTHADTADTGDPFAGTKAEGAMAGANTTIGVVATNADLTPAEAQRVAIMAHDGLARALRPAHTPFDGDTLFSLATGKHKIDAQARPLALAHIGALCADCLTRAIGRALVEAENLNGIPAFGDKT